MSLHHFDKTILLDGIRDALRADSVIMSWAGSVNNIAKDPDERQAYEGSLYGNYVWIRDNGAQETERGTLSTVWQAQVAVAAIAPNTGYQQNDGMRSVLQIEDDIRRVLTDNMTVLNETNIKLLEARPIEIPPTQTIWVDLFGQAQELGYTMAVVVMNYTLYQRRA